MNMKQLSFSAILCLMYVLLPSCKLSKRSQNENDEFALKRPYYALVTPNDNAGDGFVNVRTQPRGKSYVIGKIFNNSDYVPLIETQEEWSKIDYKGRVGYVYNEVIDIYKSFNPKDKYVVIAAKNWTPIYKYEECFGDEDDCPEIKWEIETYIPKGWILETRHDIISTETEDFPEGYWGGCVNFCSFGWELSNHRGYNPNDVVVVPMSKIIAETAQQSAWQPEYE